MENGKNKTLVIVNRETTKVSATVRSGHILEKTVKNPTKPKPTPKYLVELEMEKRPIKAKREYQADMVVDYHKGLSVEFANDSDPRFLIDREKDSDVGNPVHESPHYALGYYGWVILGYTDGFPAGELFETRFSEGGTGREQVDIWVSKYSSSFENILNVVNRDQVLQFIPPAVVPADLNARNRNIRTESTIYPAIDDSFFVAANGADSAPGTGGFRDYWQAINPNPARPNWIRNNWKYVGRVTGNPAESPGPLLSHVPAGYYHFVLLHDVNLSYQNRTYDIGSNEWDGADIQKFFIRPKLSLPALTYHLILIDDSHSASKVKGNYLQSIKNYVNSLYLLGGTRYVGVRMVRWKAGVSKKRGFKGAYSESTERVHFNLTSPEGTVSKIWVNINEVNKDNLASKLADLVSLSELTTPLPQALYDVLKKDIVDDEVKGKDIYLKLFTDGIPDPINNFDKPHKIAQDPKQVSDVIDRIDADDDKEIEDKRIVKSIKNLFKALKANNVKSEIAIEGHFDFSVDMTAPGDGATDEEKAKYNSQVQKVKAFAERIIKAYNSTGAVSSIVDISEISDISVNRIIDHKIVPHTDCLNGRRSEIIDSTDTGPRRIGRGERKLITRKRNDATSTTTNHVSGDKIECPICWNSPALDENESTYTNADGSPNTAERMSGGNVIPAEFH